MDKRSFLVWHGLERDDPTRQRLPPPFQAVANCEHASFEIGRRVAPTACRRGDSFSVAGCVGGRPCHTYLNLAECVRYSYRRASIGSRRLARIAG